MNSYLVIVSVVTLVFSSSSFALQKCIDGGDRVTYSDTGCPENTKNRDVIRVQKYSAEKTSRASSRYEGESKNRICSELMQQKGVTAVRRVAYAELCGSSLSGGQIQSCLDKISPAAYLSEVSGIVADCTGDYSVVSRMERLRPH